MENKNSPLTSTISPGTSSVAGRMEKHPANERKCQELKTKSITQEENNIHTLKMVPSNVYHYA